jgi:hypothetical protein
MTRTPDPAEPETVIVLDGFLVPKNAAANGRLFSIAVAALCAAGWYLDHDKALGILAMAAVLPIGLSVLLDQLPAGRWRSYGVIANYALAAMPALGFLLSLSVS